MPSGKSPAGTRWVRPSAPPRSPAARESGHAAPARWPDRRAVGPLPRFVTVPLLSPEDQAAWDGTKLGCTTAPPRVSMTPLIMSSVSGSFGAPASLSQNVVRKVSRFLAYSDDAATGMRPGQL